MNTYLIKRNPDFTNTRFIKRSNKKNKEYNETKLVSHSKVSPLPKEFAVGDMIYVAEKDCGIYAMGTITKLGPLISISGVNDFFEKVDIGGDEKYWMTRLKNYVIELKSTASPSKYLNVQSYYIDQKLLPRTIPLTGILADLSKRGFASSVIKLKTDQVQFIKKPSFSPIENLETKIPSSLRMDIYAYVNKHYSAQHWIDIDHFVPQSVGGPGNIIENLVPIGLSINRYKSNAIPRGLFEEADKRELKKMVKPNYLKLKASYFITKNDHPDYLKDATNIVNYVKNNYTFIEIRSFYKEVLRRHFPAYVNVIEQFNEFNEKSLDQISKAKLRKPRKR